MTDNTGDMVCYFCGRPIPSKGRTILSKELVYEGRSINAVGRLSYEQHRPMALRTALGRSTEYRDDYVRACSLECPEVLRFDAQRQARLEAHRKRIQSHPEFDKPLPEVPEENLGVLWGCV